MGRRYDQREGTPESKSNIPDSGKGTVTGHVLAMEVHSFAHISKPY